MIKPTLVRSALLLALTGMFLVQCGGGGTTPPPSNNQPILSSAGARIVLTIPPSRLQVHLRRPLYTSPSTLGIGVNVGLHPTTFSAAQTQTPQSAIDLSPTSTACTPGAGGSRVCTFSIAAPPGSDDIAVTTWDASPVGGSFVGANALSSQLLAAQTITSGSSTTISLSLNGLVSTITMVALPSQIHVQPSGSGYSQVGNALISYDVNALDADGNIITGQGAPTVTVSSPDRAIALANAGGSLWNARVVGYPPQPLALTATPPVGSGIAPTVLSFPITAIPELWVTLFNGVASDGSIQGFALYASGPTRLSTDKIPILGEPFGLASDGQGDIFASDYANNAIYGYLIGNDGAISSCLCDSVGNTAISGLTGPTDIAFGSFAQGGGSGSGLWFAECGANDFQTRVVTPTSVAATGTVVPTGSGSVQPIGLALDPFGYIWVADSGTGAVSAFTSSPTVPAPATYTVNVPLHPLAVAFDPADATRIWVSSLNGAGNIVEALSYPTLSAPPAPLANENLAFPATTVPVSLVFDASHHLWIGTDTGSGTNLTQYTVAPGVAPAPTGTVIAAIVKRGPTSVRRPQNITFGTSGNQPNGLLILP